MWSMIYLNFKYVSGDSEILLNYIILFIIHVNEIIARGFDVLVIHSSEFHSHPRENKKKNWNSHAWNTSWKLTVVPHFCAVQYKKTEKFVI